MNIKVMTTFSFSKSEPKQLPNSNPYKTDTKIITFYLKYSLKLKTIISNNPSIDNSYSDMRNYVVQFSA